MYTDIQSQGGDDTLFRYAPLVKRIAHHLAARLPDSVQIEDLIQAGMIGLLEALNNFDAAQGASFETYAGIRIRGSMLDDIRCGDWTPRSVHRKVREISKAVQQVENRTNCDAKDAEVAAEMEISLEEYYRIVKDAASTKIFSAEDSEINIERQCDQSTDTNPSELHQQSSFKDALSKEILNLPEREQLVMSLYYNEELNLREIGAVIGVSESRVCQIHGQALIRLRARLENWINDDV